MPNHITNVTISGLWGQTKPIDIPLQRQFNFIIGRNGSGKTTVINLVAAVLLADFEKLDKIIFSKVSIQLREFDGRKKPVIEVTKTQKPGLPYSDIAYRIKLSSTKTLEFDLDAFAEERAYRGVPQRYYREKIYRERFLSVQRQLEELVDVTWLSVHRGSEERERTEEKRYQSSVDQKLAVLNVELVKYFSKLNKRFSDKTQEFQKRSFLTLTKIDKQTDVKSFIKKIDVASERKSLASIFDLLGVSKQDYQQQLDVNATTFASAKEKFIGGAPMSLEEFFAIFNSFRAHSLVQLYENLQTESKEIFKPRDMFLSVFNELLAPRKQASLSVAGELVISIIDGKPVLLDELSSGEKQLLIILGQALLQESKASIYIADEPELSLHVEWQESLTSSIEKLNPNAQIVFATHSPDIVGSHSNSIVNMESVF